jgi:hypothetical protein
MAAHLIEDVQVILQRVAASRGGAIVRDKRDVVGVRLARAGAAHDGVERLMIMWFRFCHSMSVSLAMKVFWKCALVSVCFAVSESFEGL